jgi:hypothetical protein
LRYNVNGRGILSGSAGRSCPPSEVERVQFEHLKRLIEEFFNGIGQVPANVMNQPEF